MALPIPSYVCARCLRANRQASTPLKFISSSSRSRQYHISPSATSRHPRIQPQLTSNALRKHASPLSKSLSTFTSRRAPETAPTTLNSTPPPPPPSKSEATSATTTLLNPRSDEDGVPMTVEISPRAIRRLNEIMKKEGNPNLHLRITVESGGCHGFQYLMSLTSDVDVEEDTIFAAGTAEDGASGEGRAKVVMDEPSLELLKGSKIDYTMELIGSQFKIVDNPRASSSCGCGTSFDVKI